MEKANHTHPETRKKLFEKPAEGAIRIPASKARKKVRSVIDICFKSRLQDKIRFLHFENSTIKNLIYFLGFCDSKFAKYLFA